MTTVPLCHDRLVSLHLLPQGPREKPAEVPDVLARTFARTANAFLESTFLDGTFNLVEAMKGPERNAAAT